MAFKDYAAVLPKADLPACAAKFETATCGSDFRGAEAWAEAALGFGGAHDHALLNESRKAKRFVDVCGAPMESLRPPSHAGYADEHVQLWIDEDPQPFHTWAGRDDESRHRPSVGTQTERHAGAVRYAVDRFDRRTAIRVARDFERSMLTATADLTDGECGVAALTTDALLPARPPPPPKKRLFGSRCVGCFPSAAAAK